MGATYRRAGLTRSVSERMLVGALNAGYANAWALIAIGVLAAAASPTFASNGLPVFSVSGTYSGTNVITNSASVFLPGGIKTVQYTVNPGDTAATIATSLADALNAGDNPVGVAGGSTLPDYFTFADPVQSPKNKNIWIVQGAFADGSTVTSFGSSRTTGRGLVGARIAVAVDPLSGDAVFELSGSPVGGDTVELGIDGLNVSTTDTAGESDATILQTLDGELTADGLANEVLNSNTDTLTVGGVDTGNPDGGTGADVGAYIDTTDPNLSTFAEVTTPEPSALAIAVAGIGLTLLSRRRTST